MKIGTIDNLALDISTARVAEQARSVKQPVTVESVRETAPTSLGMDFSGMEEAHSLDADRVAALIADPFGEE